MASENPPSFRIEAYRGDEPFAFVSYDHRDSEAVFGELERLATAGLRVYYDEGINPGHRWHDDLANALEGCAVFVFFATSRSVRSRNCQDEIVFVTERDKPIITVYLEDIELPPGLRLAIGSRQAIARSRFDEATYRDRLISAVRQYVGPGEHRSARTDRTEPARRGGEGRKSIAVLPFDNMSPSVADAYFSDGLTEEIISRLSHLGSLRVISRSSAMALKGMNKDIRTIGVDLDVQYVLEGSVRKARDAIRITAQLIDAQSDEHLWGEKYEGTLGDVFRIQDEVSEAIVRALDLRINAAEEAQLLERPIADARAYDCYLKARSDIHNGSPVAMDSALRHLEAGLAILGDNPLLYEGMAELHLHRIEYGIRVGEDAIEEVEKVEEWLAKLEESSPVSAESHYLRGRLERFQGSHVEAVRHFEKALELDPSHAGALLFLVVGYSLFLGRSAAAEPYAQRLAALDPFSPLALFALGLRAIVMRRFSEALDLFERALAIAPSFVFAQLEGNVYVHLWEGDRDAALATLASIEARQPHDKFSEWATLLRKAISDTEPVPAEVLSESAVQYLWNDPEAPWLIASAFCLGRNHAEALRWLERSVERGWINYPLLAQDDPLLEPLRDSPRFSQLMSIVKEHWASAT